MYKLPWQTTMTYTIWPSTWFPTNRRMIAWSLSDLDGFLTAISKGPELIMPSEWLPVGGENEAPEFESTAHAEMILNLPQKRVKSV
jgi:yecA family protein